MNYMQEYAAVYKPSIDIYIDYATNYNEIKRKVFSNRNINLDIFDIETTKRVTKEGYKMKYHRDNYMLRKFPNSYLFIPFSNSKTPIYTLIWYMNSEFTGGSLEFLLGNTYKPRDYMFIFFDSNQIHRVNKQESGTRIAQIYKFYKSD